MLRLSKDKWYYAQKRRKYEDKYHFLKKPLFEIARVHPEYGYRRTTAELRARGIHVNHKVIERLHSYWDLSILKNIKHPKKNPIRVLLRDAGSTINLVQSLERIADFEVLYTDFTEIHYKNGKTKAHWMPIIDHCSKVIVGHALGESADTELALEAWEKAKFMLKRLDKKVESIIIHHDQDGVYIGHRWLSQVAVKDKVRISYSKEELRAMSTQNPLLGGSNQRIAYFSGSKRILKPWEKLLRHVLSIIIEFGGIQLLITNRRSCIYIEKTNTKVEIDRSTVSSF